MTKVKTILREHIYTAVGIGIGLISGYVYYQQIGCVDGCTITGDPLNSTLYGGLMGGLLLSMVDDYLKKHKK